MGRSVSDYVRSTKAIQKVTNVGAGESSCMHGSIMAHCLENHHITGHLVFVLVSPECVIMCPMIGNPTRCEISTVIPFIHAKNMSAGEIHRELSMVYAQNVMSKGTVRQWR
jgi:hypothetical protein